MFEPEIGKEIEELIEREPSPEPSTQPKPAQPFSHSPSPRVSPAAQARGPPFLSHALGPAPPASLREGPTARTAHSTTPPLHPGLLRTRSPRRPHAFPASVPHRLPTGPRASVAPPTRASPFLPRLADRLGPLSVSSPSSREIFAGLPASPALRPAAPWATPGLAGPIASYPRTFPF